MSAILDRVVVVHQTDATEMSRPSEQASRSSLNVAVSKSLCQIRASMEAEDCLSAGDEAKSNIFRAGMEIASAIGPRAHGGMVVSFDDGVFELVVDNCEHTRRIELEYDVETNKYRISRVTHNQVMRTSWMQKPYVVDTFADWLLA